MILPPNKDAAKHHLQLLDPTTDLFTYQVFHDSIKDREKAKPFASTLHGALDQHWKTLCDASAKGCGIFITVNKTDLRARRTEHMLEVRGLFREMDRPHDRAPQLQPHIKIQSSPGRFHEYYLCSGIALEEFSGIQQRLVDDFGSDPEAKDITRVLRLAGFPHQKNPDTPHMVCIIAVSGAAPFTAQQIREALPPVEQTADNNYGGMAQFDNSAPLTQAQRLKISSMLEALDPDMPYTPWLKVGMVCRTTSNTPESFQMWDDWSGKSVFYEEGLCEYKWNSFRRLWGAKVTMGSLVHMAQEAGWSGAILDDQIKGKVTALCDLMTTNILDPDTGTAFDNAIGLLCECESLTLLDSLIEAIKGKTGTSKQIIKDEISRQKKKARKAESTGPSGGIFTMEYLDANVATIDSGPIAYFDVKSGRHWPTDKRLNASCNDANVIDDLGDITLPSNYLASSRKSMKVSGVTWSPVDDRVIEQEGREYANTYIPINTPRMKVDNTALLDSWLHLVDYICGEHKDMILQHMAYTLQHPERKIRWAPVITGAPRTGKDLIFRPLTRILGPAAKTIKPEAVARGWDDPFHQTKWVRYQEMPQLSKGNFNDLLKAKIADDDVELLNVKGRGQVPQRNVYNIVIISNIKGCLEFDLDQAKIFAIDGPDKRLPDSFYDNLCDQMNTKGYTALAYNYLMELSLEGFTADKLPSTTQGTINMVADSRSELYRWVKDAAENHLAPFTGGHITTGNIKSYVEQQEGLKWNRSESIDAMKAGGWSEYLGKIKVKGKTESHRFYAPFNDCEGLSYKMQFYYYHKNSGHLEHDTAKTRDELAAAQAEIKLKREAALK